MDLILFILDNIEISEFIPKVIIDSIEVNGVNKKDISNIKLNYNENNIKINFFTNDYTTYIKQLNIYYKLNGLS